MFFRWKAPADFEGEVFFRYSAVVEYDKYWVNKDTPKIRVTRSAPAVAAPAPETPVTSSNTEAPEQGDSNSKILFPEEEEKQTSVAVDPVRMSWLILFCYYSGVMNIEHVNMYLYMLPHVRFG